MNEDVVYGLLAAILLVCYIIALRVKHIKHDVECMHDFVHELADHPLLGGFNGEMVYREKGTKNGSEDVPAPFKEWDES